MTQNTTLDLSLFAHLDALSLDQIEDSSFANPPPGTYAVLLTNELKVFNNIPYVSLKFTIVDAIEFVEMAGRPTNEGTKFDVLLSLDKERIKYSKQVLNSIAKGMQLESTMVMDILQSFESGINCTVTIGERPNKNEGGAPYLDIKAITI